MHSGERCRQQMELICKFKKVLGNHRRKNKGKKGTKKYQKALKLEMKLPGNVSQNGGLLGTRDIIVKISTEDHSGRMDQKLQIKVLRREYSWWFRTPRKPVCPAESMGETGREAESRNILATEPFRTFNDIQVFKGLSFRM